MGPFASNADDVSVKGPGVGVGLGVSAGIVGLGGLVGGEGLGLDGTADCGALPDSPKAWGLAVPPVEPVHAPTARAATATRTLRARRRRAREAFMGARRG
jgi:hypothetical protein